MSNTSTPPATTNAPGQGKTMGIQAGARSRIQVISPGAASKSRAPNWCMASSNAETGWTPGADSTTRLWVRNTNRRPELVSGMETMKHFDGPTFEADVLQSSQPVVVDFYAEWCGPCRMMSPVVEQLASELAGQVVIGKLDVDVNQEIAIRYGVMGIPTLGLFRGGNLVDRLIGYPGGKAPIKAWIAKNVPAAFAAKEAGAA